MNYINLGRVLDTCAKNYSKNTDSEVNYLPDDIMKILFTYTGDMNYGFGDIDYVKITYKYKYRRISYPNGVFNPEAENIDDNQPTMEVINCDGYKYSYYCNKCVSFFNTLDSHTKSKGHNLNTKVNKHINQRTILLEAKKHIQRNQRRAEDITDIAIHHRRQVRKCYDYYKN